jgi:RNA polymerase sigma-70 factor, ECF subfamily
VKGGKLLDNDIFTQVYNLYLNDIYMYVFLLCKNRQTAEDIAQETFIKAFLKLEFPDKRIKSWLLAVAHNTFIDYYRKSKKQQLCDDTILETIPDSFSLERQYLAKEQLQDMVVALDNLPLNQKRAVILSDFNELSYAESAQAMGVTIAAYKNLLYRARITLKKKWRLKNE